MADTTPKSQFEVFVELIKALAWPVIVLVLLTLFWHPLRKTAELVPTIVGRSDVITIAGLSIKVSQGLKSKASPEVEKVLARLTKQGIERVLEMGDSSWWEKNDATFGREQNLELVRLKLVREVSKEELSRMNAKDAKSHGYGVERTALGRQVQSFLRTVVAEFVEEIAKQSPSQN